MSVVSNLFSGLLGGGKTSAPPAPTAPSKDTASEASEARRRAIVAAYGSQPFFATTGGASGVTGQAPTATKTLLGS